MTGAKKTTAQDQFSAIEDALVESIIEATEAELREDCVTAGHDPDKRIARVDDAITRAKAAAVRQRLARAKAEVTAFRAGRGMVVEFDSTAARAKFEAMRAKDPELAARMMMAARKGEGLSDQDLDGLLQDLVRLERLDREDGDQ